MEAHTLENPRCEPPSTSKRRAQPAAHLGVDVGLVVEPDVINVTVAVGLLARDLSDSTRTNSPLIVAQDAFALDTTGLSVEETLEQVLGIVREKFSG